MSGAVCDLQSTVARGRHVSKRIIPRRRDFLRHSGEFPGLVVSCAGCQWPRWVNQSLRTVGTRNSSARATGARLVDALQGTGTRVGKMDQGADPLEPDFGNIFKAVSRAKYCRSLSSNDAASIRSRQQSWILVHGNGTGSTPRREEGRRLVHSYEAPVAGNGLADEEGQSGRWAGHLGPCMDVSIPKRDLPQASVVGLPHVPLNFDRRAHTWQACRRPHERASWPTFGPLRVNRTNQVNQTNDGPPHRGADGR